DTAALLFGLRAWVFPFGTNVSNILGYYHGPPDRQVSGVNASTVTTDRTCEAKGLISLRAVTVCIGSAPTHARYRCSKVAMRRPQIRVGINPKYDATLDEDTENVVPPAFRLR